jgi:hypothetical protein
MVFRKLFRSLLKPGNQDNTSKLSLKDSLLDWIDKIEHYAKPSKKITALNFGLFESDKGFMIYLTGAEVYDASDNDWASQIDYEPIELYKYLLLKGNGISGFEKWDEILELVSKNLKEIIAENPEYALFKNKVVTTGFDDGDLVIIKENT